VLQQCIQEQDEVRLKTMIRVLKNANIYDQLGFEEAFMNFQ
jgi:hypothetical protein